MLDAIWKMIKLFAKKLWRDLKLYWPMIFLVILMEWYLDFETEIIALLLAILAYMKATDLETKK